LKNLFTFLIFIFLPVILIAQSYKISGTITDAESGTGLSGAIVELSGGYKTASSYNGNFVFEKIPYGKYILTVSYIGYETIQKEITADNNSTELKFSMKYSPVETGEITVTSIRHEQMIKNIPMPLEIVGSDYILRSPSNSVPEILTSKPGLSITRDGVWGTDINIRGLSKYNVVTLVDGNRIETATDVNARLSMIDLTDIERIEVIKGGSSTLYGTGATGGVVNIITKGGIFNASKFFSGSLLGGYNSVNNNGLGKIGLDFSDSRWFFKINGTYRKADNLKTPQGELKNSQFRDYFISTTAGFIPFKNHELKISYQRYDGYDIGIPGGYPLFPNQAKVTYPREIRDSYAAEYRIKNLFTSLKNIFVKYFYTYILRDVENIPYQVTIKPASGNTPKQRITVEKILPVGKHYVNGIQLQTDWVPFNGHYLVAGIDIWQRNLNSNRQQIQKIENLSNVGDTVKSVINKTTGEKPIPDASYRSMGFFAQDDIKLPVDKLKLTLGARVDKINVTNSKTLQPVYEITNGVYNPTPTGQKVIWEARDVDNFNWSGSMGLLYNAFNNIDFTLNVSRSFRSPSMEERYQYIDLGSVLRVGNPDLNPEQGLFFDIGTRLWMQRLSFTGNIFANFFTDLVVEQPGTYENRNALIKQNIGKSIIYGFDFDVMYNFYGNYVGYATLSYARGEDTENSTNLPQIPPLNGRIGIKGQFFKYLIADLNAVLFDRQDNTASGELSTPGYGVFNLNLSSAPFNLNYGTVRLFAGVENIFDLQYRNHLSSNRGTIYAEPGRNFYFKAALEF